MNMPSVTPAQVEQLLASGAARGEVVKLLVATGAWTQDGASEIVSSFTNGAATPVETVIAGGWPGPFEEVPPLFAS